MAMQQQRNDGNGSVLRVHMKLQLYEDTAIRIGVIKYPGNPLEYHGTISTALSVLP